jgi:glycosyltransferase 2 family protein
MPDRPPAPARAAPGRPASPSGEPGRSAAGGSAAEADAYDGPGRALRRGWTAAAPVLASRPVRWGFVAVTVALGGYAVAREWNGVRAALVRLGFLPVAGALLSVLAALFATMLVWRLLLAALGSPLPVRAAARVMFVGQLGKYLPGSVWPVLAQMELGHSYQVPRHRSATASVLTILLSLLSGLLAALVTLPFVAGSTPYLWAFLAAPVLLVLLHPRVLNRVLERLLRLAKRPPLERPLAGRALAGALAWAFVSWILFGLQVWFLATRLGAPAGKTAVLAVGGFAFAWCVGFLVVFAPAGAGVREVLLVATLGPVLGAGSATAVALVSRAVMTAGDLLTAGAAAGFTRSSAAARQAPPETRPDATGEPRP